MGPDHFDLRVEAMEPADRFGARMNVEQDVPRLGHGDHFAEEWFVAGVEIVDVELADALMGVFREPATQIVCHAVGLGPVRGPGIPMIGAQLGNNTIGRELPQLDGAFVGRGRHKRHCDAVLIHKRDNAFDRIRPPGRLLVVHMSIKERDILDGITDGFCVFMGRRGQCHGGQKYQGGGEQAGECPGHGWSFGDKNGAPCPRWFGARAW